MDSLRAPRYSPVGVSWGTHHGRTHGVWQWHWRKIVHGLDGRLVVWRRTDGDGTGVLRVTARRDGWRFDVHEVADVAGFTGACTYHVVVDRNWRTREVAVAAMTRTGTILTALRADDDGSWTVDGSPVPDLAGCHDVDVASTPATNTFPIRQLAALREGQARTLRVVWVDVPSLLATPMEQTYVRGPVPPAGGVAGAWTYSDPTHGSYDLWVDQDGLVVEYAGFATRL